MYGIELGEMTASAGKYYNSVSDSYENVPKGSSGYGNSDVDESFIDDVWTVAGSAYTTTKDTVVGGVKSVYNGAKEVVSDVAGGVGSFVDSAQGALMKQILFFAGLALLAILVVSKSGILGQAAPIAQAYVSARSGR